MGGEVLVAGAGSASKLDDQAFTHEVGAIWSLVRHGVFGWRRVACYIRNATRLLAHVT